MKAMVYWFSGTGNSWLIASRIASGLDKGGVGTEMRPIEEMSKRRPRLAASREWFQASDGDTTAGIPIGADGLDVFCFPVFSFTAPGMVDRFLSRLPVAIGRRAAVVATMGGDGYEGRTLRRASRMLKESGRKVELTAAIEMPEAFVQAYPATPPEEAAARTEQGLLEADRIAADLLAGRASIRPPRPAGIAATYPLSALFKSVARRLLGLMWSASPACTACGSCAAHCPAQTIRMAARRPHWGPSCEACQRCANICPVGAIRISIPKLLLIIAPVFLPYGKWLPVAWGIQGGGMRFLLWLAGVSVATILMAAMLWLLDFVPGLRDMLSVSYAGSFRRRLAPGFAEGPLKKRRTE